MYLLEVFIVIMLLSLFIAFIKLLEYVDKYNNMDSSYIILD
jgi:hypothetical protein